MFVGCSTVHVSDVYHIIHAKTNQIIYSQDDQWLNKLWGEYYKVSPLDCFKDFVDRLGGHDDNDGQDDLNPPAMPNIEGMLKRTKNKKQRKMSPLYLTHTVNWSPFQYSFKFHLSKRCVKRVIQ